MSEKFEKFFRYVSCLIGFHKYSPLIGNRNGRNFWAGDYCGYCLHKKHFGKIDQEFLEDIYDKELNQPKQE